MGLKTCAVSYTDHNGSRHSVTVSAESLYEAAALGLKALQSASFIEPAPGPATRLEVEITHPSARHVVTVQQLRTWLNRGTSSPAEVIKRRHLKELLEAPKRVFRRAA
jgi:hypothetical protein